MAKVSNNKLPKSDAQNKKSSICFVLTHVPDGSGKIVGTDKVRLLRQAKLLVKMGHSVTVFTTTVSPQAVPGIKFYSFSQPSFYKQNFFWSLFLRILYLPIYFIRIYQSFKRINPDIFHHVANDSPFTLMGIVAGKLLRKRVYIEVTLFGANDIHSMVARRGGNFKKRIFSRVDRVINLSPLLVDRCASVLPRKQCTLIGNYIDADLFMPATSTSEKSALRERLGLAQQAFIITQTGRIRERKGQLEVIQYLKEILPHNPRLYVVFLGGYDWDDQSRSYYKVLSTYIKKHQLHDYVHFANEVSNISEWLRASDIFMFASSAEGLPNAVLEAMATGLPVVMKELPGTADFIINSGVDGYIYHTPVEAVEQLQQMIDSESLRREMGAKARQTIESRFTKEVIMGQYIDLYQSN